MLVTIFAATVLLGSPAEVDSVEVYAAVLQIARTDWKFPVVLADTRSGVACMPFCAAQFRDGPHPAQTAHRDAGSTHSPELMEALRTRGLVEATCESDGTLGCGGPPGHMFVGLGEISSTPDRGPPPEERGVWVRAVFLLPGSCADVPEGEPCMPDAFGYWYLVVEVNGSWAVKRQLPAFHV